MRTLLHFLDRLFPLPELSADGKRNGAILRLAALVLLLLLPGGTLVLLGLATARTLRTRPVVALLPSEAARQQGNGPPSRV